MSTGRQWLSREEEHYWDAVETRLAERRLGDHREVGMMWSNVYEDARVAVAVPAADPYDSGVPISRGRTCILVCGRDTEQASRWARRRGIPPSSYRVAAGCRGAQGLRGHGPVVFIVLPEYWPSVPCGERTRTVEVFDHLVARLDEPVGVVLDVRNDEDRKVEEIEVIGTANDMAPLMHVLTSRGRRASDRG